MEEGIAKVIIAKISNDNLLQKTLVEDETQKDCSRSLFMATLFQ